MMRNLHLHLMDERSAILFADENLRFLMFKNQFGQFQYCTLLLSKVAEEGRRCKYVSERKDYLDIKNRSKHAKAPPILPIKFGTFFKKIIFLNLFILCFSDQRNK